MKLFTWIALLLYRRSWITANLLRTSIRYMRGYHEAYTGGQFLPTIPKALRRSNLLMTLVAAFRLSLHEPALFVFGALCFFPALAYSAWWAVLRLMRVVG